MRTLTVTRGKTFVGCASKIRIYVEDYTAPEITVLDTPCRLLGTLKNNETQSFEITEEAVKIFAIADKASKNYCNEFYPIPAGIDPVTLSGQCRYNPMNGNAFRFDGVTNEAVLANRRKNSKRGLLVLVAAVVVGVIIGLASTGVLFPEKEKTFTESEFSITLTNRFDPERDDDFYAVYGRDDAVVMIARETFAELGEYSSLTVSEYIQAYQESNAAASKTAVKTADGLCYFDYNATVSGDELTYRFFAYKSSDAFWTVQIAVFTEDLADSEADIMAWAKSFAPN